VAFIGDGERRCDPATQAGERIMPRHRFKQDSTLKDRLLSFAKEALEQAAHLPPGPERDTMLTKALRADTAAHIDEWINSPGLQPPK
jgi:hypothetical protein